MIDQISARLDGTSAYTSPWATAFSVGRLDDPDAGYFFSADRHWLFLFVRQRREEGNFAESRGTIEALRRTIARLQPEFPGVRAGVTGGPAISNDEMATAFDDSKVATLLAFAFTHGAPRRGVPARGQAGAHGGDAGREPRVVDGASSPSSSATSASSR